VIVRWGLAELPGVLDELSISRPLVISVVSIPTTYSGAEWTSRYGMRDASIPTRLGGGGARTVAIVYEVELTLDLPARESAGTAMNALAHYAEALYTACRAEETDAEALAGAPLISRWLPVVVDNGHDLEARRGLLEGATHAGAALRAGTGLGHAIAQEFGGRYGLPRGTMNAVSLPAVLRFNSTAAAGELARVGEAIDRGDPVARVSELTALADPSRLRDYEVPREDLPELARGSRSARRRRRTHARAPPDVVLELLDELW
jgi:maleylacetate reductase